jgi:hypothetical protein
MLTAHHIRILPEHRVIRTGNDFDAILRNMIQTHTHSQYIDISLLILYELKFK